MSTTAPGGAPTERRRTAGTDRSPSDTAGRDGEHAPDRWGLPLGVAAFLFWGVGMPLFFPLLEPAGAIEIIAQRILWSLVFCVLALVATRTLGELRPILASPRMLMTLGVASVLIVVNWTVYVYGVLTERVLDAALGYFLNPVVTVLLAVLALRERLRPAQWVAVGLGLGAVVVIATGMRGLPWIAVCLALSFSVYGLVKNRTGRSVGALPGLTVETMLAAPPAAGYLIWLGEANTFADHGAGHAALLVSAGIITALPLLLFGAAARRLPLSVVGALQYLGPMLQFLVAVLILGEQMPPARWVGFGLVWSAITVLTWDGLRAVRRLV
ncbi:EamA family transporter RarD [Myceligenerans salitolerans]|uniref:EamA family transporter RarD n=1 Tax=Myceligenerans salitolerans TaxID=1230528 RepID=A0ABS3I6T5_9MICO|nr:EamA family transporter RarD [Myceligenerans salitolerans]MBO0608721.1 EamA family transporter RarD [Myceligenerans salitolerans]